MFARRRGSRPSRRAAARGQNVDVGRAIRAIADAAARWTDADFPPRVRATRALIERTGYTEPVVDFALDALFGAIDAPSLAAVIAGELGNVDALRDFVARPGRPDVRYAPLDRAAIVSSDTTIGVAIPPLVFALCAGCRTIVKDRNDRLVAAFLETIAEEEPELGGLATAAAWAGTDEGASRSHIGDADTVIAFGGDDALRAIRTLLAPHARFAPFGHRTSIGYVSRSALANATSARVAALGAARDALLYDGDGCLSLHLLFVERGGAFDTAMFARTLADAFDELAVEFPAGYAELDPPSAAYRRSALFRAAQGAGAVYAGILAPHLIVTEPPTAEAPPLFRRTLAVRTVDGSNDALAYLRLHAIALEAVAFDAEAIAVARDDLTAFAVGGGASRVAKLGDLQRPPLGGDHGGVGRILPFVRAIYRA